MADDTVDVNNSDLANIINNPKEYKNLIIEILEKDPSEDAQKTRQKLLENKIDGELDMRLRSLSTVIPYNIMIPVLRDQLGLSIQTDKDCVESLKTIQSYLKTDQDKKLISDIINFVSSDTGELDHNIIPEIDLISLIDQLPIEKFPEIYKCIDYINAISE
jgi:hypothetical protein